MEFSFERNRIDKIPRSKLIEELVRVAHVCAFCEFGKREFDTLGSVSASSVVREFGTWTNAIEHLRSVLAQEGKELQPKHRGYFSESECFAELERIWKATGHRPSRIEWENSHPSISYTTYVRYFGGWANACLRFLEARNNPRESEQPVATPKSLHVAERPAAQKQKAISSREVPPGLRLRVYERDRFRCVFCGRSPISSLDVQLHVDHVHPFSQGGETVFENLQTLCSSCNLGKSDRTDVQPPNG